MTPWEPELEIPGPMLLGEDCTSDDLDIEDPEVGLPVNRLYNSSKGKHLFSSNENEIDILTGGGWEN